MLTFKKIIFSKNYDLFTPHISEFICFFQLQNLFSITVSLDDYEDLGINEKITNTGTSSITKTWNFRITDSVTTSQLETSYRYNEGEYAA